MDDLKSLQGRITDLQSAYKQLPILPTSQSFAVISVTNPNTGEAKLFKSLAIMFGETAAVYGFLRLSRALAWLLVNMLLLVVLEFFDDFTQLETSRLSLSTFNSIERFFSLLGWQISMKPKKRLQFSNIFTSLGAEIDLSLVGVGTVIVRNKPGRLNDVIGTLARLLESEVTEADLVSLRGKILYAESFIFGRVSAPLVRAINDWTAHGGNNGAMTLSEKRYLECWYP